MHSKKSAPTLISLLFILMSIAGAVIVYLNTTKYGIGISHDSVSYLFAAQTFSEGNGFQYYGYPSPFVQWPPLYPFILAIVNFLQVEPLLFSTIFNAIAFAGIVFLSGKWLYDHVAHPSLALIGTLAIALSPQLHYISEFLWTETLFILLSIAFFISIERYILRKKFSGLVLSSIFVSLACLDRYTGITLVIAGVLILFFNKNTWKPKSLHILLFGFISSAPTAAWLVRNYLVSGTFAGLRPPATVSFLHNIKLTILTFTSWVASEKLVLLKSVFSKNLFTGFSTLLPLLLALVSLLALVVMFFFVIVPLLSWFTTQCKEAIHRKKTTTEPQKGFFSEDRHIYIHEAKPMSIQWLSGVWSLVIFVTVYIVQMLLSASNVSFDPIGDRYLIPVFVPFFFLLFQTLDLAVVSWESKKFIPSKKAIRTAIICALLWMILPVYGTITQTSKVMDTGAGGFQTTKWHENSLVQYVKSNEMDGYLYSNNSAAAYFLTDKLTYSTPKFEGPDMYNLVWFEKAMNESSKGWIIWFGNDKSPTIYSAEELAPMYKVKVIKTFPEGTLYTIEKE